MASEVAAVRPEIPAPTMMILFCSDTWLASRPNMEKFSAV
jgi:hypothetical protein